jgi:poly(A) polymerase
LALPSSPRIIPRAEHTVSRRDIDPDALKVLYRLKNHGFIAYLVGGGVRDLLLGRKPKDFDVSTNAQPQQVKRLFRNCFIIGRRFRLAHVRFGRKVIEVSTFRRQAEPEEGDTLIRRDNLFGTPEQDAFRRDFTVNALFYDIANFSVIDYVGGLEDLEARIIRTIGEPDVRFREDPVRMLRAVVLAARLSFTIDRDTMEAIRALRGEIVKSSPPRILEEFYKILRQGAARRSFEMLHEAGLLAYLLPEADADIAAGTGKLLGSLARLDDFRNSSGAAGDVLTSSLLVGTLLVPLRLHTRRGAASPRAKPGEAQAPEDLPRDDVDAEIEALGAREEEADGAPPAPLSLPFARRDLDRVRLILAAQRRLRDLSSHPGAQQALASRNYFDEAVRWLEVHGGLEGQELALHWRSLEGLRDAAASAHAPSAQAPAARPNGPRRRRRRRRRGERATGPTSPQGHH